MASLQDLIQKYISDFASTGDKNQAAKNIVSKLRSIQYTGSSESIPNTDLLSVLRIVKGSANDSHIELIDAVIATLEKDNAE